MSQAARHKESFIYPLTKHPDVAGGGEPAEVDALGRHPLDGQLALARLVVCVLVYPPRQPEVGELDAVVRGDEDVPGGDVAVDEVLGLEV